MRFSTCSYGVSSAVLRSWCHLMSPVWCRTLYPTDRDGFFACPGAAISTSVESTIQVDRNAQGEFCRLRGSAQDLHRESRGGCRLRLEKMSGFPMAMFAWPARITTGLERSSGRQTQMMSKSPSARASTANTHRRFPLCAPTLFRSLQTA